MSASGAAQLAALGLQLKGAQAVLRRNLLAGIRAGAQPAIAKAQSNARERLPHTGGLNERVAKRKPAVRTRLTGRSAGIRVTTGTKDTRSAEIGRVRHPVYGNRSKWVEQDVRPLYWSDALRESEDEFRRKVEAAMAVAALEIQLGRR